MAETFLIILTAHLLGDFFFQTDRMVKHKRNAGVLLLHAAIVTIAAWLLMGTFYWPVLLIIFLTHFVMDTIKVYKMKDSFVNFLIDQFVHLVVLAVLAYIFHDTSSDGCWSTVLNVGHQKWYFATLCLISGLLLLVPAGGNMIGKATNPFKKEIAKNDIAGLKKGGQYIGWLERFLVLLLILIKQPTGIGFLIAAKSILRFGEIKNAKERKVAEYIIIGTFLSFGWALLISTLTLQAIQHWLPGKMPNTFIPKIIVAPSQLSPLPTSPIIQMEAITNETGTNYPNPSKIPGASKHLLRKLQNLPEPDPKNRLNGG